LVLVLVVGLGAGIAYSQSYLKKRATEREVAAGWREYDDAAARSDFPGMGAALDRVLAANPRDPLAVGRKTSLATGTASPDDPDLALVFVEHYLRHERLAEAAREARKALARYPKHWRSLCVLAHHALQLNHDPGEARRLLGSLPDPEEPAAALDIGGLLYAVRLSEDLRGDCAAFRGHIIRRLLPLLRSSVAQTAPPLAQVQLVECYLEPFADPTNLRELADHWAAVSRLADAAVTGAAEAGDTVALVRMGQLGPRLLGALSQLRDSGWIPADRFAGLVAEVEGMSRRAWLAVGDKEPAQAEPYHGLALVAVRRGNVKLAIETLLRGLTACGDRAELLDLLARLAMATGNSEVAFEVTWAAAERAGTDPLKWCIAASAALDTGRHYDAVLAACANIRKVAPNYPAACRIEARLWLESDEPGKALATLESRGHMALRTEPALLRLHARALAEAKMTARAEEMFDELEKREREGRRPHPVLGVALLRGVLDAKPDAARAVWVARRATRLLAGWPDDVAARWLLADAQFRRSELGSPPWNPELAYASLAAYDRLPASAREDPAVIAAVAALRLKALGDVAGATRAIAPLRDPGSMPLLTPTQREVVGAVLVAGGKPGEAVSVLEWAVRGPGTTAGCWVQLALAYHAEGRSADARAALERAGEALHRSSREEVEWRAASGLIQGDEP
jgi:predicted Zn-dependent protease